MPLIASIRIVGCRHFSSAICVSHRGGGHRHSRMTREGWSATVAAGFTVGREIASAIASTSNPEFRAGEIANQDQFQLLQASLLKNFMRANPPCHHQSTITLCKVNVTRFEMRCRKSSNACLNTYGFLTLFGCQSDFHLCMCFTVLQEAGDAG